ncbi:hypothetical protein [Bacteroides cellulosilyticus]|uniref:hypothetical protein n=1 Tax=Bacteroides cellulosilyticus TaxID=246787 RepID=UPI0032EEDD7D
MTFRDFMKENGYDVVTTFWEDFSAADIYGIPAVSDTFNRAFEEWKGNHIYLTELVLVLNHKIWQHHESSPALAKEYDELWRKADSYAVDNLQGSELEYFYDVTD